MKTLLVIGGASDIGLATARYFATQGYSIILAGRNTSFIDKLGKDLNIRSGVPIKVVAFDALDFDSHKDWYATLEPKPDVCLCVFGYLGDQLQAEADWKETERVIDTNFKGAVSILNIVASDYAEKGKGSIIGVSSVAGERGRQSNYIYGSAKAGFTAYLSGLRNRMHRHHVHVLTVNPGFVRTKMTEELDLPSLLTATPDQVARKIYRGSKAGKDVLYVLPVWKYIMLAIKTIPEAVFKRMKL